MKDKKGFTLIELLAVIVILAIIMVIATMQVNKTIKKSRENSFKISYESLKRQVKQKIVTGEDYLCFNSQHYNSDEEMFQDMNVFFGNNFSAICGSGDLNEMKSKTLENYKDANNKLINLTDVLTDFGTSSCQSLYNISNDYVMSVGYQPYNGDIVLNLGPDDGKFNGVNAISTVIENVGSSKMYKSKMLDNNYKISYDSENGILANVKIEQQSAKDKNDKDVCVYNASNRRYENVGDWTYISYQCNYNWNSKQIENIKNSLSTKTTKDGKDSKIFIKDACDILTNKDNWSAN